MTTLSQRSTTCTWHRGANQLVCAAVALMGIGCGTDSVLQPTASLNRPDTQPVASKQIQALCPAPPFGLVGWWRADGDAADAAGGHDGTLNNGVSFVAGKVGNAFLFDGVDDNVFVAASPGLNVGPGPGFTLQAWFLPDGIGVTTNSGSGPIIEYFSGLHLWSFGSPTLDFLFANLWDGSLRQMWTAGVTQHVWNHGALTYDKASGVATLYVNGGVGASVAFGAISPITSNDLYIGYRKAGPVLPLYVGAFKGSIDDAQIYNRALSPAEIQTSYQAGISGACQLNANAGGAATGQEGSSVSFNGSASTGQSTATYDWNFGDGSAHGTGATPGHTYADNGTYAVTLTMTDGLLTSTALTSATIANATPVPTLTLQTVPPIHVDQPFTLRAGFSDAGRNDAVWTYKFFRNTRLLQQGSKSNLPPPGATQPITLTMQTTGTFTFRLEITDKDGATGVVTLPVTVVP